MKRPSLTVRRLMALVAVVGLVLGPASWLARRSARLKEIAHLHERASFRAMTEGPGSASAPVETPRSRHHDDLALEYHQAARYPWVPVAPDLPEVSAP
jgi:hypothetical protein